MSLNSLFVDIDKLVRDTNSIINALTDPNRKYIDQNLAVALYNYNEMLKWHTHTYNNLDRFTGETIKYLLISYGQLVREYDDNISRIRVGVDAAFTQFYNSITYKLKSAIGLTYNEIADTEDYLIGKIESATRSITDKVTTKVDKVETTLTGVIDGVVTWAGEKLDGLLTKIGEIAATIYDYVTTQISAAMNTITSWVNELWGYVTSIMSWLTNKFNEFYVQIVDWVSESISAIYARITREVDTLTGRISNYYNKAESLVNSAKASLISRLNGVSESLRALLDAAIYEVKDRLSDLTILTDWRFAFFNLSLSYPELGFLQVLNRDDETFNRFKPYWQALFARVMEEE